MNAKNETFDSAQPSSPMSIWWVSIWNRYNSPIVWLLLVAYLGVVSFLMMVVFPVRFVDQSQAGFFEIPGVVAIGVMGLIGVGRVICLGKAERAGEVSAMQCLL